MAHIVFVILCFLMDEVLSVLFTNSYLIKDLIFVSNLGFCAMVLTIRKFSFIDSCLFAFVCGMIYDFCFANTFLIYAIIYTIIACLLQLWSKHMTETLFESIVLAIVTIFVKDLLIYCYMSFQRITSMSLMLWAERYELLTLLGNAILVMAIFYLIRIKDDYLEVKALRIRKGEKVEWFKLKSKQ